MARKHCNCDIDTADAYYKQVHTVFTLWLTAERTGVTQEPYCSNGQTRPFTNHAEILGIHQGREQ